MKVLLQRHTYDPEWTLGSLYLDGVWECFTLEDAARLMLGFDKIPKRTAIPAGVYTVVISYSQKFERLMPLILAVPGFDGVRIHSGNQPDHTDGCPLTGTRLEKGTIWHSRDAYNALFRKLQQAEKDGGLVLHVQESMVADELHGRLAAQWTTDQAQYVRGVVA